MQTFHKRCWRRDDATHQSHVGITTPSITQFLDWRLTLCNKLLDVIQMFTGMPLGIPWACSPRAATCTATIPSQDGVPTHAWLQEQHRSVWISAKQVATWPQLHARHHQMCPDIPRNLSNTGIQNKFPILLRFARLCSNTLKRLGRAFLCDTTPALPLYTAESALCTWVAGSSWARLGSWSPASCRRHNQSPWQSPQ